MTSHDPRRAALADFLRRRRERLTPAELGLPPGRRRRTPGLRREEVAELAELGTDWYTRLEQAREINVSARALTGLADALRLSPEERRYLFVLAGREGDAPAPTETTPAIGPTLRRILDELRSCPAFVMGWRTDVLAWNRAATEVFGDFAALPAGERTWLRLMFADTPVRRRFVSWEPVARDYLAIYRATSARHVHDPAYTQDVADLTATSDEFRRWWSQHEVAGPFVGLCEVNHPTAGRLSFEGTTLHLHGDPGLVLSVETAAPGSDTTAKLARLLDGPPSARPAPAP